MAYIVTDRYKEVIYSQDDNNDIKIFFNGVELEDAGYYVEKVSCKSRILPEDGKKRFSLDNFISKEIELIIHNIDPSIIQDQVQIQIGTFVDSYYEYIPLGIFNIQDTPTTNNNRTTIKLRDNRVKFDFKYDAKPLIDSNGGTASYLQILQDICQQANIESDVTSFDNDDLETSFYDNTVNASVHISYLAEQCGMIPIITREGHLDFLDLTNLTTWRIPLSIISDNYELGEPYNIERVVYESGVIKYETSNNESLNTLYINSANSYIVNQQQISDIYTKLSSFEIDSVSLSEAILGNPAIDPYDIIEVYDDYDENEPVVFRTLANCDYTFKGNHRQLFKTEIGKEERTENVTLNEESSFKKWASTNINQLTGEVEIQAGEIGDLQSQTSQLTVNINNIQGKFQITGGSNLIKNSQFLLTDEVWTFEPDSLSNQSYHTELGQGYNSSLVGKTVAVSNIVLRDCKTVTTETNITNLKLNVLHTLNYYISQDEYTTSTVKMIAKNTGETVYEDIVTTTNTTVDMANKTIAFVTTDTEYVFSIESSTTLDGFTKIYDLMFNVGDNKSWEPAASEVYSTILKMSQLGMQVYSSGSNIITLITSDGFQIREATMSGNGEIVIGRVISEFDKDGLLTDTVELKKLVIGKYVQTEMTINSQLHHIEYFDL